MAKARATQGKTTIKKGNNGSVITDIEHEPIARPGSEQRTQKPAEPVEAEIVSLEITIQKELQRFSKADAGIAEVQELYKGLTVTGTEDKEGYDACRAAWRKVLTLRTDLEKKGLEIRRDYTAINKAVKIEEDRLIAKVKPLEDRLEKLWRDVDLEKARLEKELEEQEQAALMARINELVAAGATMQDGYYAIGDSVSADVATIRSMPEENYQKLLAAVKAKQAELTEARRLQDEADQRQRDLLQQQKDDQDRLDQQLRDKQAQQQRLQADLDKQAKLLADQKNKLRASRLEALGMTAGHAGIGRIDGPDAVLVKMSEVEALDDEAFEALLNTTATKIQENKEREQARQDQLAARRREEDRRKEVRSKLLEDAGMVYNFGTDAFKFDNGFFKEMYSMEQVVALETDAEVEALADDAKPKIEQAKLDAIKRQQEQDALAKRTQQNKLSDSAKLKSYLDELDAVEWPDMTTEAYKQHVHEVRQRLGSLIREYQGVIEEERKP